MIYPLVPATKWKFCGDCGRNTEHIVKPNPKDVNHVLLICSGCMPMTFLQEAAVKRIKGKRKFRLCPTCRDLTQIIVGAKGEIICSLCNREKFEALLDKSIPKIQRPSKDIVK